MDKRKREHEMQKSIVVMDVPVKVNLTDWLNAHQGRSSIASETGRPNEAMILAYSDDNGDAVILERYANAHRLLTITSNPMGGITDFERV